MRAYLRRQSSWTPASVALVVTTLALGAGLFIGWPPTGSSGVLAWFAVVVGLAVVAVAAWRAATARRDLRDGVYEEVSGSISLEKEEDSEGGIYRLRTPLRTFDLRQHQFRQICEGLGVRSFKTTSILQGLLGVWVTECCGWAHVMYLPGMGVLIEVRDAQGNRLYANTENGLASLQQLQAVEGASMAARRG
jgi:hypothetical protein